MNACAILGESSLPFPSAVSVQVVFLPAARLVVRSADARNSAESMVETGAPQTLATSGNMAGRFIQHCEKFALSLVGRSGLPVMRRSSSRELSWDNTRAAGPGFPIPHDSAGAG